MIAEMVNAWHALMLVTCFIPFPFFEFALPVAFLIYATLFRKRAGFAFAALVCQSVGWNTAATCLVLFVDVYADIFEYVPKSECLILATVCWVRVLLGWVPMFTLSVSSTGWIMLPPSLVLLWSSIDARLRATLESQ